MARFFGAILGYMLGGFVGAIAGFFLGSLFDRGNSPFGGSLGVDRRAVQDQYFETTFALMGHIAKADGRVSEEEIKLAENLMQRMGLTSEHRKEAIRLFKMGAEASFDLHIELHNFRQRCGRRPSLINMLLVTLISTAYADNALHSTEHEVLQRVAAELGFNQAHFERILGMVAAQQGFGQQYQQSYRYESAGSEPPVDQLQEAYKALGVAPSATDKQVKRAYRKLMSQHHPDKLIAKGLPDDMIELATEKTQEIQSAYDVIEKQRKANKSHP
ncbi:MAG: co-chaperone DjlA [Pseudomonadales bacterium]